MGKFKIKSKFNPTGDQPQAIEALVKSIKAGNRGQTLLGVTGSGKTFTMANIIEKLQRPTIILAHKDRYDDIKEGVVYKQGEVIYSEGTKAGNKVGGAQRHVHFEICAGKTTGSGWKKSPDGTWNLVKGKKPTDCYFIDDSINVIKNGGLNFKKIETPKVVNPVERDETTDQLKVLVDSLRVRTGHSTKDSVLGFVQKNAIYNYYETYNDNTYTWYRIGDNQWIADNGEWLEIYVAVDYKQMCETLLEEIKHLKEANSNLANENLTLKDKLKQINELSKGD